MSILEKAGIGPLMNQSGGMGDWEDANVMSWIPVDGRSLWSCVEAVNADLGARTASNGHDAPAQAIGPTT